MKRFVGFLFLLFCTSVSANVSAETIEQAYKNGLKKYYAGDYKNAIKSFKRLVALPTHHEDLFYNLGCAYFRAGEYGKAIFNFERALKLKPDFENAAFNLEQAKKIVSSDVKDVIKGAAKIVWWKKLARIFSLKMWWVFLILFSWIFFGILIGLRFFESGPMRSGVIALNSVLGILVLSLALMLFLSHYDNKNVKEGIILPAKLSVRQGPDVSAKSSFNLHAGLKVELKSESNGWMRIRLSNGLEGWVKRNDIGVL